MKKLMKVTQGKKFLSLVLAVVMMATIFNMALPVLKLEAEAADVQYDTNGNIIIDGVTQERVVSGYESTYENYAAQYLNGASNPTNIVIPGLNAAQDYVVQGMTYYPERDWMLVTAYHNTADDEEAQSSKVFAIDAATGDFVAMFSFLNPNGTVNTDHGGGIAISEHNIYYACGDMDRKIAYAPISALENAPLNEHTQIQLVAERDFVEVGSVSSGSKTAYTAYVCYDEGILWTGNFYDPGADLLGINIAATDYNTPSNNTYQSMVFGYKLQGSTSEEEWANLIGAKGTDCQGNPSYTIGLNNAIKDVQYAVVDNGKLYLSRSFGSGAGNSVNFGFGETSLLTVADIDLSQPGTTPVTISTTGNNSLDKVVMAYNISEVKDYNMMPMSEGLCFIDDQLFITFEGASNKYLNESSGLTAIGNCTKPIDVIWQLDPYELMEVEKPAQEKSIYYERVQSLADIENGEEYIILFESVEKDPVTQKNILYAFNSNGNFNGNKLSKSNVSKAVGYDGMIGHKITEYSVDVDDKGKEILYLTEPKKDDIENVRWTINNIGGSNYSIKSTDTYFANCNNFYANDSVITMAPGNASYISNLTIGQLEGENGYFYISDGANYLWCNDGTDEQVMATVNKYYEKTAGYSDITEVAGTFHCNATNSPILGSSVPEWKEDYPGIWYPDGAFKIYRREVDSSSSTYESRVYSNLDTKLEADGTYTVTLDTYAISPNHYQYVGERPTDYIIVADTSNSMISGGSTGISEFSESDTLEVQSLSNEADTSGDRGEGIIGYTFYNSKFDIRYLHTDGKYYKMYMAINNTNVDLSIIGTVSDISQYYFLYYIADDGKYYCFSNQSAIPNYICTEEEFKAWVANPERANGYPLQTASSTETANGDRMTETLFKGKHYRFDNINSTYTGEHTNIDAVKTTAQKLIDQIAVQNSENRIALVQYGSETSYLSSKGWASSGYTDAFWDAASNADNLKTQIDNISAASAETSNDGIELEAANAIINNSGINYKADGKRNVAVIFLSDGIPGKESVSQDCDGIKVSTNQADAETAANKVIATAQTIKDSGAFIYSVLFGNNSAGDFSKKTYMDAVSSKYPAATNMTKLGGQSVDGINYALNIATASYDYFVNFGSVACKEVATNNSVGLDNLDASSYLREVLSEAFKFPQNKTDYSIKAQLVPGEYDEIGRFRFGTPTETNDIVPDIDEKTKTVTVTGYDYSTQYISRYNPGNALRLIIKGLLADETADLNNALVNVGAKTGIYKSEVKMNSDEAFRNLPQQYIYIPEYTYVLDYGIDMYDSDVNGTMLALDNGLNAQPKDSEDNIIYRDVTDGDLIEMTNGKQDLIYKMTPASTGDKGYVLIQRPDESYDWFRLNVVPASNVYYEEDELENSGTSGKIEWSQTGTTEDVYRDVPGEDDPYGYDKYYDDASQQFSNDSYLNVDVTSEKGQTTSKKKSFTFIGTGFDLMSACGTNTGVLSVAVKDQNGKSIKGFMVDTYFNDSDVSTLLSQVPVVSWSGDYGTYTVDVAAVYVATSGGAKAQQKSTVVKNNLIDTGLVMNSAEPTDTNDIAAILESVGMEDMIAEDMELIWFDDNSIFNGGTGVAPTVKKTRAGETAEIVTLKNYIDGFRIYNPLGTDQSSYEDSEKNAKYVNVIDNLMTSTETVGSIAYIVGQNDTLTWADYETVGPQNELYLNTDKSISFNVTVDQVEKVMLGLRAVNGETKVTIASSTNTDYKVENIVINSATEMYYDITKCFGTISNDDQSVTITITNTGDKILAVNHIKHSGGDGSVGSGIQTRTNARSVDATQTQNLLFTPFTETNLVDVQNSMNLPGVQGIVKNGVIIPLVEEEEESPDDTTTPGTGDDDANTGNNNTTTDSGETEESFSIFSLIEALLAFIKEILFSTVGSGNLF